MEGRPPAKENTQEPNLCRTPSRESGATGLARVREASRRDRKQKFTALLHHVSIDLLRKFGLELHPDKMRLIEFGRFAAERRKKRGEGKPETFNFLGFTHLCGTNHKTGNFTIYRRTMGKRMAAKLKDIQAKLRVRMHVRVSGVVAWLQQVVRGYFQYHAVPSNLPRMAAFRREVARMWHRTLRRRSQRSRLTWDGFNARLACLLPAVQVLHPYPDVRFDVKYPNIRGKNRVR